MDDQPDMTAGSESLDDQVIAARAGPVVRLATLCESVIEEVGTHTSTIVRMIDGVHFSPDEVRRGDTTLVGYVAFMGYLFPGEEDEVEVAILFVTNEGQVFSGTMRSMRIQAPNRAFAIASRIDGVRIPGPGQYLAVLAYQNQEIARVYVTVYFGELPVEEGEVGQP